MNLPALCGILGTLGAALTAGQNASPVSSERHVVIAVAGRHGEPITDLLASEITIREDGAARSVLRVARATAPMQIALIADDTQIAQPMLVELRDSLTEFTNTVSVSNPTTQFSLWTSGGLGRRQGDFTTSVPSITRAVAGLYSRPGVGSYLMEALVDASAALSQREDTRTIIVTQLLDESPELSTSTELTVTNALRRARASLWTIVIDGNREGEAAPPERRDRTTVTTDAATASGGGTTTIFDRLELRDAYRAIASRITTAFDITYARPDVTKPPTRLEVKVKRSGTRLFAPEWAPR